MTITLTVAGRIATVDATTHVVAGNTYPVTLALDSEWTGNLYLRVRFGSLYYDIPFASSDTSVDVQMPVGYPEVGIGVFSEALEICTSEARVRLLRSILEAGEQVVEFDSDLYDQWAGEVTTLLTDDAFDAESTRPVQNAVLTAWKDTVPLDSALVHKTGNETVGGSKTFTSDPAITALNYPVLKMDSQQDTSATGIKGEIRMMDRKNGSQSAVSLVQAITNTGYNIGRMSVYNPDKSQAHNIEVRSYSDHQLVTVDAPYYPVDGSSNPQALTANALMASGNIAVDPRLVHTSGIETIAGAKTFTSLLTASNVQVKDASTPTVTMLKGSDEVANLASDGTQAGLTASSQFFGLRGLGTAPFGQAPSYTADNSADAKIVTRAMLASSPTVVHTTGSETVAGEKTFSNGFDGYPTGWHKVSAGSSVGQYNVFARISANDLGRLIYFEVAQSSNRIPAHGCFIIRAYRAGPVPIWSWRSAHSATDSPIKDGSLYVLVKDDVIYLAWKRQFQYGGLMVRTYLDTLNGNVQSTTSSVVAFSGEGIGVIDNLDGYTVYEVTE